VIRVRRRCSARGGGPGGRIALVVMLVLACRAQTVAEGELARGLRAVAAEGGETEARLREAEDELGRLARKVEAAARAGASPVAALNATVFDELGFAREVDRLTAAHTLLPPVLRARRGSCVGLGTLYLAVAQRLGWRAHGVLVPGHFFVRVDEGGRDGPRSVELLRSGEPMPEAWYRQKYLSGAGTPAAALPAAYLRALTTPEVLAVVRFNLANHQREAGALAAAERGYRQAARDFPTFPEAHASLGLTLHLLRRLPEARQAYQAARRLDPALPGLARNLEALDQDLAAGPASPAPR
jgi:regulator of sirC expression with transglutaminase-like and TPR domain